MRRTRKRTVRSGGNIHLRYGKVLPKALAKIVGRCAECYGPLKYHNTSLACDQHGSAHQGFMHRDDAAPLLAEQAEHLAQLADTFTIQDGQLVPRTDPLERSQSDDH